MIYVYATSTMAGVRFAVRAHMPSAAIIIDPGPAQETIYQEGDEIYVVGSVKPELLQAINRNYGRSWPRPHIFKYVQETS